MARKKQNDPEESEKNDTDELLELLKHAEEYVIYTTAEKLGKMLNLSPRRIKELRTEDAFVTEETKDGPRYHLAKSFVAYAYHLRKQSSNASLNKRKTTADVRLKEAKAEEAEIKLAQARNEMHSSTHVRILFSEMITQARAAFMDIPGRAAIECSKATPSEAAEIIKREIHAALSVLASYNYDPTKFADLVKSDGGIIPELEDDDTQPKAKRTPAKRTTPKKRS